MALLIQPDGTRTTVVPEDGMAFTVGEFCRLLGAHVVEMVALKDGRLLWMDEYGPFREQPEPNWRATCLLHQAGGRLWDTVHGPALITGEREVGVEG